MKIMSIKKKICITSIILLFILLICGFAIIPSFAENSPSGIFKSWGDILHNHFSDETSPDRACVIGNTATVSEKDIQTATQFYMLQGLDEQLARNTAIDYMEKREALYQAAIQNGYSVSDDEVHAFIAELKQTISSAENKDDAFQVISSFESEDDYWEYQFYVYQKNLPIQNYVKDLEKSFYESQSSHTTRSGEQITWEDYFENYKKILQENEHFETIEN